jgi:hypothetical protein
MQDTEGSKNSIPCCALPARQVRATFASDSRGCDARIRCESGAYVTQISLVPVVSHLRITLHELRLQKRRDPLRSREIHIREMISEVMTFGSPSLRSCQTGKTNMQSSKTFKNHLKEQYREFWRENFYKKYKNANEAKFCTYVSFKCHFSYENYLDHINCSRNHRVNFTKMQPPVPRDERWCPIAFH